MKAYYNENEPFAAAWLRNLVKAGHIPQGDVDERNILDVHPEDLRGYGQCHFFAGIGGWPLALRLSGWPDDRPAWTGSCPCQPFSAAGGRGGFADERHLWPAFHHLIVECRPASVYGEQVASKDGLAWLDLVSTDMEAAGYAFAAVDLCAAGVGAPHIRQRLWWVGSRLADAVEGGRAGPGRRGPSQDERIAECGVAGGLVGMGQPNGRGPSPGREAAATVGHGDTVVATGGGDRPDAADGFWANADWLFCRDGKWRPVEPGTFPRAHGLSARVGRLRGYGNAIVPQVAAVFIQATTT